MQAAEQKQKIIQSVLEHGGPCASARDVKKLVRKTRTASKSLLALKAEIRYQKTVLAVGGGLRLTGSREQLFQSLMAHLGGPAAVDNDSASDSDTAPARSAVSARKRTRGSESDTDSESGSDSNSGELTLDEPQVLFFFFQTADAVGQCFL